MKFRFSLVHRSRSYWTILTLFAVANLWSWLRHHVTEPVCCDRFVTVGFPFPFHISGGIAGRSDFLVTGMLLDIVLCWTLALIAAWIGLQFRRDPEAGPE